MIQTIILNDANRFLTQTNKRLQRQVDVETTVVTSPAEAEAKANEIVSGVLVCGPSIPFETASRLVAGLAQNNRGIACILAADNVTTKLLQQALRAGFRDVTSTKFGELDEAIRRVYKLVEGGQVSSETSHLGEIQPGKKSGSVISFFSTKGGVGKTVFATNTGIGLALQKNDVILLDLDFQFGDVGVMLGLKPERTIADLVESIDRLDADLLSSFLTEHESGLRTLLAPVQYETTECFSREQLTKLISTAREIASFVIIDTAASFADNTLTILDNSDCINLVTTLDVPSIKNAQIALQTLEYLDYPKDIVKIILNRADSKVSLSPSDV